MIVENLFKFKSGIVIKNYKEMCNLLGEKIEAGNSKKAQLREWERFFKYHKEGHKFVIDEVYDEPKEKIDFRGSDGLFSNDMQSLILDMLVRSKKNTVFYSCAKLLEALRIVNENYSIGRRNMRNFSKYLSVSVDIVHDFYQYEHRKLKANLESALNSLERKGLIQWNEITMICVREYVETESGLLEEKNIYREATDKEIELISDIYDEVLKKMGLKTLNQIYLNYFRYNKFDELIKESLLVNNTGILSIYNAYKIIQSIEYVSKGLEEEDRRLLEKELNLKTLQSAYKSIEDKVNYARNMTEDKWGESQKCKKVHKIRSQERYADSCKRISEIIINLNHHKLIINENK